MARAMKHREGLALLTTSIVLLLVAMLAFAALRDSERESTAGARSRAATHTVHGADAGIQLAWAHLMESPPDLTPINVTVGSSVIQSRTRSQSTPVNLDQVGLGPVPEGYSVNLGNSGVSYFNRIYRVNMTATTGTAAAELEAKLSRLEAEGQGY